MCSSDLKITAISAYRPTFKRMRTMQTRQVVDDIAGRTGLNEGEIRFVAYEIRDTIIVAHQRGQAVKIDGLGTFTPTMRPDGTLDTVFRAAPELRQQLSNRHRISATILNRDSIGKSADELVARWNAEHPDDPVTN